VQLPLDFKHAQQERYDLGIQQDGLDTGERPVYTASVLGQEKSQGCVKLHSRS
jgi:hypothetical protein